METTYNLCVMCCCSFPNNLTPENADRNSKSVHLLQQQNLAEFCNLLKKCTPPWNNASSSSSEKIGGLLEYKKLSMCTQCGDFVKAAVDSRSKAGELEVTVKKLQLELQSKMRELTNQMEAFYQDMSKIEKVIKGSDESYLHYHLQTEEGNGEEDTGGKGNRVIRMRKSVLGAVKDLRSYQSSVSKKSNPDVQHSPISNRSESLEFVDASALCEVGLGPTVKMEVDDVDLNYEAEEDSSFFPGEGDQIEQPFSDEEPSHDTKKRVRKATPGSKRGRPKKTKAANCQPAATQPESSAPSDSSSIPGPQVRNKKPWVENTTSEQKSLDGRTCAICFKVFATRSAKSYHQSTHLPGRFPCPYCSKVFQRRHDCKRHVEGVHKQQFEPDKQ